MIRNIVSLPRAVTLAFAVSLLSTSLASAQANDPAPSVPAVQAGPAGASVFARLQDRNIWITRTDGFRLRGRVKSASDGSMVFDADGVITAVPFDQIARIEKSSHRLRNGALAGLISGAGLGLGIWAGACSESCDGEEAVALVLATGVWAGIGAGAGVGIGALVNMAKKPGDVLYDAPRRITMSVAPILSKTQKGVALSLTWR